MKTPTWKEFKYYCLGNFKGVNIGDKVIVDGVSTGLIRAVTDTMYQVQLDDYDYGDDAYDYHNFKKERVNLTNTK